jgi:hypothetical protein
MIFKSWVKLREALSQGGSLPRVASSSYFAQDQQMDDKIFPAAGMDSNLDPAKKKVADQVKEMLVGGGGAWTRGHNGIIGEADKHLGDAGLSQWKLNGYYEKAQKTIDINVLDHIIDLYYIAIYEEIDESVKLIESGLKEGLDHDIVKRVAKRVMYMVAVLRGLEDAKIKSSSVTGKDAMYVGSGGTQRSNMYARRVKKVLDKINTY